MFIKKHPGGKRRKWLYEDYDDSDAIPEPVPGADTKLVSVPAMELDPVPHPASIASDGNRLWRKEAASL